METAAREKDPKFIEYLRNHFRLDQDGETIWRLHPQKREWSALAIANHKPYLCVRIRGVGPKQVQVALHRLIWFLAKGQFPSLYLDHIDRNKRNNHISNLREVTNSENLRNAFLGQTKRSGLSSRFLGVYLFRRTQRFRATVEILGSHVYLGYFDTEEEAARARDAYIVENNLTDRYKLNFPLEESQERATPRRERAQE